MAYLGDFQGCMPPGYPGSSAAVLQRYTEVTYIFLQLKQCVYRLGTSRHNLLCELFREFVP